MLNQVNVYVIQSIIISVVYIKQSCFVVYHIIQSLICHFHMSQLYLPQFLETFCALTTRVNIIFVAQWCFLRQILLTFCVDGESMFFWSLVVLYILLTLSQAHINVSLALSCICARWTFVCVTLNRQSVDAVRSKFIYEFYVLLCYDTIFYRITFEILEITEDVCASLCVIVTIGKPYALILSSPCVCLFCVSSHCYAFSLLCCIVQLRNTYAQWTLHLMNSTSITEWMELLTVATLASLLHLPVVAMTNDRELICVIDRQRWARSTRRLIARRRNWSSQADDRGGTSQRVRAGLRCESLHQWYFLLVVSKLDSWVHLDVQLSFHSRFRSTDAYDLLTGRFKGRFSQSALLPRIELVHCAVVMHIHLFYTFVHTCFHHSFTHFHFI